MSDHNPLSYHPAQQVGDVDLNITSTANPPPTHPRYKPTGKKSNNDFFDAAAIVLTEPLASRSANPSSQTAADDTGVLVTPEMIRTVDALTQEEVGG